MTDHRKDFKQEAEATHVDMYSVEDSSAKSNHNISCIEKALQSAYAQGRKGGLEEAAKIVDEQGSGKYGTCDYIRHARAIREAAKKIGEGG